MLPSPGRIVHYSLDTADVTAVEADRRNSGRSGNPVAEGDVLPAVIVRIFSSSPDPACNLQVLLDGTGTLWVTSRHEGDGPGTWAWPPRA